MLFATGSLSHITMGKINHHMVAVQGYMGSRESPFRVVYVCHVDLALHILEPEH